MNMKKLLAKPQVLLAIIILMIPLLFTNCGKKRIPKKTQIILISVDTLRGDHLSSYGYSRDTSPNISRLVEDSMYYTQAYPNGCWTMPSHMSLLTGTLPSRHGVSSYWGAPFETYQVLNQSIQTMTEILKARHIHTMKFALLPDELGFSKGFDMNNSYDPFFNETVLQNVLQEIDNFKEKDFFLFVHTWMVHAPYTNCHFLESGKIPREEWDYINNFREISPIKDRLVDDFRDYLVKYNLYNPVDCVTLYDSGIHYVDRYIGKMIDKLKELGIYKEAMVIIVGDHGEHFDEHFPDLFYSYHGKEFYEEFIKVPLILKYPYGFQSGTAAQTVSLVDVFPTVFDFYEWPIPGFVQGESLLKPVQQRKKYIVSEAISEKDIEKKMIRIGDLKYIVTMNDTGKPGRVDWNAVTQRNLFDLKSDPRERKDLYPDLKYRRICLDFEKLLAEVIKNSVLTNGQTQKTSIGQETVDQLKSMGYL